LKVVTSASTEGTRWLPLSGLCGQDQSWTDPSCARLCNKDLGWSKCVSQPGCVYVYASNKVSDIPTAHRDELVPTFGNCVAANGLVGSSPPGSSWQNDVADLSGQGLKVRFGKNKGGKPFLDMLVFPVSPTPSPTPPDGEPEKPCVEGTDAQPVRPSSLWPSNSSHVEHWLKACRCSYWRHVATMGSVLEVRTDYAFANVFPAKFLQVEYGCWRNVLSKTLRMPVQFEYIATADTANYKRSDKFSLDLTSGLEEWQPPRWSRSDKYGVPYDVGHLVMANHFDSNRELIHATNLMTNVLPQLGDMNRFAWLATEMLTECAREGSNAENVFVIGGCVWSEDPDHIKGFKKMEKVGYSLLIPDYCWKVIATPKRGHVAFFIPNTVEARISKKTGPCPGGVQQGLEELNKFVVSLSQLEDHLSDRQTPQTFQLGTGSENAELHGRRPTAAKMFEDGWSLKCDMA